MKKLLFVSGAVIVLGVSVLLGSTVANDKVAKEPTPSIFSVKFTDF
ncbi:hypothetical protein [Terribacillus saccharophilus]|nr:hypothetical protein [Terribacillus saccharophilus]